tara:strand:+ start:2850 stop:3515 length:666 start_codon:yes stop_codon:yes gene_type:complete
MINHAIILAAGRGIRLMPLTKKIPKAMVKIKNQTLILNGIKKVQKYISNIHITVGYKGSMIAKHVIRNNVRSVINTNKKGNAWWIFNFPFNMIDEPVAVLTCDNITKINFKLIEKDYIKKKNPHCFLVPVKPVKNLEGDFIHRKRNIVTKLSRKDKSDIYCSGIQILNPYKINKTIKKTEDFNILWKRLIRKKKLFVSDIVPNHWFTIDNVEQWKIYNKKY